MRTTKGARFEAHRRLTAKHNASIFTQSLLAIYVIVAGLIPLIIPSLAYPDIINVLSIATGIFVLVLNHTEAAQQYNLRADRMLRGAQLISELYNQLRLQSDLGGVTVDECRRASGSYDAILKDNSENHDDIDFDHFKIKLREEYKLIGWQHELFVWGVHAAWWLDIYGVYVLLILLPPALWWGLVRFLTR